MKLLTLCCFLIAGCTQFANAQTETVVDVKKEKTHNHYVGVQLNSLIRQVINFNNNTSTTPVNPYMLIYSVNSVKTGWGLRAGAGYHYNSSNVKDGVTETDAKINSLQLRVGIEKRFELSRKWTAGAGLDAVISYDDANTNAVIHSFDTTITLTKTKLPAYGGGAMGWLRYNISDRILVGTEASFYYVAGTEDREIKVTKKKQSNTPPFNVSTTTTITNSKPKFSDGSFKSPVVFFLIIRI